MTGLRALAADAPARRPDRARRRPARRARVARLAASCCASSPGRCGCCRPGTATSRAGRTSSPARAIPSDKPNFVTFTQRVPVGVVAAIVPWNSPLLLLTWKLAPALATGCTMVVKPSDHTPVTALELAKLVTEAGIPDGVFNVITGNGPGRRARAGAPPGRRQGRVHRLDQDRHRRRRGRHRATSRASRSSSAASRPRSSSPTPTSRPPPTA